MLGPRAPAPDWQAAVRRTPVRTADGCVVDQIPAGLLIRPAEATAPRPGDLFHAIPVDPRRPAVIVGVPWGEDVVATDVAELLGALPAAVRPGVRLVPGGRRDLLPLGQSVAALLNAEVEVATGLPLFAADGPLGTYRVRSVLIGPDGEARWLPFVDAVMCLPPEETAPAPDPDPDAAPGPPPAPAPRLLRWTSPVPDLGGAEDGTIRLSDDWQAVITRAGLWVGPRDGTPPPRNTRQVSIEGPVIEVGRVGDRLDASLWPVLSRFLGRLAPDLRARTTLDVHALAPDGGRALRILTAEHALRVIRFAPASRTARPVRREGAAARTGGAASSPVTGPVNGPVQGVGSRPVPLPATAAGGAGETAAAGDDTSVPGVAAAVATAVPAPDGLPEPPKPSRVPVTATGGTGPGPAAPGRPATVSAGGPDGGSVERTLSSGGPTPEPASEPAAGPLTESVSEPVVASVVEPVANPVAKPVAEPSPEAVTSESVVAGPASRPLPAPQTPRPEPVATGAPAPPVAPARPVPTAGGAVPRPPSPPTATEVLRTEAPRTEAPRTEAPRTEAPRTEAPRTEAPRTEAPRTEAPRTEAPRTEAPRTEAPRTEAPRTEAPRTEAPRTEAPRTEVPRKEAPRTEAPRKPDGGGAPVPAPAPRPPAGTGAGRPLPAVPVPPRHRSTTPERNSFRKLAEPVWERHSAAVNRALAGMPALRGEEMEAARIDLIALRMYLRDGEGPLDHAELTRSLRAGEQRLVPYAGCLVSGLGRLPSHRGAVLRGPGGATGLGELRPGDVLRDPAPLSGLPLDPAGKDRIAGAGFAIWSITGRRVRQLLDGGDEVVFAPGTAFKVLDVRTDGAAPLVLLRQLPDTQAVSPVPEDADDTALTRLEHALTDRTAPGAGDWPDRCAGPVGDPGGH
ncbi:hypothetical protein ACQEV4_08915 [Streptomyces shenzhenensis]|uniref:hypothetical protein n=1 Tax=Streptomyces shenzhenensis TaxID=943815 RepID=UPI003D8C50F4